ncbi:MAG: sigma-70 family RNA polymerase sigma factor [Clostridiales Family XIII bacterium]|jgi:RNA polymerase sigma factor|nr:sigma-70 family RNA polymerase sigma factor [Clostridiales Family XIII bacterium]
MQVVEHNRELDQYILMAAVREDLLNQLIEENKPYIMSRVIRYAPGSSPDDRDDLFSIGLSAFFEAVKSFRPERGHFYPFADVVLRRRIIDGMRRSIRQDVEVPILEEDEEGSELSRPVLDASIEAYGKEREREALIDEIDQFTEELAAYGISMDSLARHSPKHKELKRVYRSILDQIAQDEDVKHYIFKKRVYPVKKIAEITGISQKKLERSRIYMIAAMIILCGDYNLLSEYIPAGR